MRGRTVALTRRICSTALVSDLLDSAPPACGRASAPRAAPPALLRCAGRGPAPLPPAAPPAAARPAARATPQAAAARRSTQPRPSSTAAARSSASRGARGWLGRPNPRFQVDGLQNLTQLEVFNAAGFALQGAAASAVAASSSGRRGGTGRRRLHALRRKQGRRGERENGREGVKVEDSTFGGYFCIYSCHMAPSQGVWT